MAPRDRAGTTALAACVLAIAVLLAAAAGAMTGWAGLRDAGLLAGSLLLIAVGMADVATRALGGSRARVRAGAAVGVVAVAAGLLAVTGDSGGPGVDRERDVARNAVVARTLPLPPGSRRIDTRHAPYSRSEGEGIAAYGTLTRYRAATGLDGADFIAFYRRAMPRGWRLVETIPESRAAGPILNYRRGSTRVSLNADNIAVHRFEIGIETGR